MTALQTAKKVYQTAGTEAQSALEKIWPKEKLVTPKPKQNAGLPQTFKEAHAAFKDEV